MEGKEKTVWTASDGWICPPFPTLASNEFALALRTVTGQFEHEVEAYLQKLGFWNEATYLGKNGSKDYKKCMLLYPLRIYQITLESDDFEEDERWSSDPSNQELAEDIAKLAQDGFVPMASIVIITPELQKLLTI